MDKIRVRYKKTGKARYISHLDLMTVMQRSLIRAGVSLKYSEGFNPHPYISIAMPASVGIESECEMMDAALAGGSVSGDVNKYLPEGIEITDVYRAWRSFGEIKWIKAECCIIFRDAPPPLFAKILMQQLTADKLVITKKTKRGVSESDVAGHIRDAVLIGDAGDSCVKIEMFLSAQNPTIGYKDIVNIAEGIYADNKDITFFDRIEMKRIDIYDRNMLLFK